jgi:predicted amidophosphoribosyltransferase
MTFDAASFPKRFTKIDALTRPDHYYLDEDDHCYFLGEYTARKGFSHSATNRLIINYKKPMVRRGKPEWKYKQQSIEAAASAIYAALAGTDLTDVSFVPVPPSKAKGDALYDDRVASTLHTFADMNRVHMNRSVHVCEAITQISSTEAAHDGSARPNPAELLSNYTINVPHVTGLRNRVFIFDDVLTTGCHYKAVMACLQQHSATIVCAGLFLARRAPEAVDFAALF